MIRPLQDLGFAVLRFIADLGALAIFTLQVVRATLVPPWRLRLFVDELYKLGVLSLVIICVCGLAVGMVLGLPFGIWACIVLGRPEVTAGFFGEKRQAGSGPAGAGKLGAGVANRFLSLARSFGRYIFTTRPGWKRAADAPQDATPSAINGPGSGPGVNSPDESHYVGRHSSIDG